MPSQQNHFFNHSSLEANGIYMEILISSNEVNPVQLCVFQIRKIQFINLPLFK